MPENESTTPESLACPICQRPLRRTSDRMLSALECEQCGSFSDFNRGSARGRTGGDPSRDDPGSDQTG
jgi:hypothetical protein